MLYPPANRPSYNLDYASRHWMEYTYPSLKNWTTTDDEHEHHNHEEYLQQRKRRSLIARQIGKKQSLTQWTNQRVQVRKSRGSAQSTLGR